MGSAIQEGSVELSTPVAAVVRVAVVVAAAVVGRT